MEKKGLGRGLGALIPRIEDSGDGESPPRQVGVDSIAANPLQPRRLFDEAKIDELAASIRYSGIIQPLLVRRSGDGYELIAGERRLRAAVRAGLRKVPVVVREASDNETLQLALIENLQRENLNPIEEATAYRRLQSDFGLSQEEIAERVGKSRPAVANSMRLLLRPKDVQQEVAQGRLPAGQARALLSLGNEAMIVSAARMVIAKGLSTRATEGLVNGLKLGRGKRRVKGIVDPDLRSLVERLEQWLGTKVRLFHRAESGKGKLEIEYYSIADFERVTRRMMDNQG
jgi:ParB family chromosome partitioning protein